MIKSLSVGLMPHSALTIFPSNLMYVSLSFSQSDYKNAHGMLHVTTFL